MVDTRFFGIWWSKLKVAVHELEGLELVLGGSGETLYMFLFGVQLNFARVFWRIIYNFTNFKAKSCN